MKQTLAVLVAALAGLAAMTQTAAARPQCPLKPTTTIALAAVAPCAASTVPRHRAITFVVTDSSTQASTEHPYLDVQSSKRMSDGHLVAQLDGTGVFSRMTPLKGHADQWTLTVAPASFASWWDNHRGTVYVQVDQLDSTTPSAGVDYSPIVTLRVG